MNETRRIRVWAFRGLCAVVFAVGWLAMPNGVGATTINLATLSVPSANNSFGNSFDSVGSFTDEVDFKVSNAGPDASLDAFIASLNLFSFSAIDNLAADLFNQNDPGTSLASFAGDTTSASLTLLTLNFSNLAANDSFRFVITGDVNSAPGSYDGSFTLSAVPLPGALILFGSALVGLVGVGRRRRRDTLESGTQVPVTA